MAEMIWAMAFLTELRTPTPAKNAAVYADEMEQRYREEDDRRNGKVRR